MSLTCSDIQVIIWDENQHAATLSIDTVTPIRGVKIVIGTVYVALQHSLQVHTFSNGNMIHKYQTAENLGGILCLSDTQVAFPGRVEGQIQIVDIATGNVSIILGHDAPLRALCFSKMGDMLASASDKVNGPPPLKPSTTLFHVLTYCAFFPNRAP